MKILAIESSCDETSAAVIRKNDDQTIEVLSNVTASSLSIHATTGGIIPENAAREQVKWIIPVIQEALEKSAPITSLDDRRKSESEHSEIRNSDISDSLKHRLSDIDAIAVTYGPGLIGSLLVGVETAKTLSFALNKPLIPVNHLLAHLFANWLVADSSLHMEKSISHKPKAISFPFVGLIVSGGHTDLLYFESISNYQWLGGTRDDAAGEALDKIGRLLGLSYPAGPEIERRASLVKDTKIKSHSPLLHEETFDFSFSGLKTEAMRYIQSIKREQDKIHQTVINEICYAVQKAIFDVLIDKTLKAVEKYNCQTLLLGGGVAANQTLKERMKESIVNRHLSDVNIFSPEKIFCTDNAAMVGAYAALNSNPIAWHDLKANPELYFDQN